MRGGKSELGSELGARLIPADQDALDFLRAVVVLADMDNTDNKSDTKSISKRNKIEKQIKKELTSERIRVQSFLKGSIKVQNSFTGKWRSVPTFLYLFPDNKNEGTLERFLLAGAKHNYLDLLTAAQEYIQQVDADKYPLHNFDGEKATVGVIANVLKPGKANQVSIEDNNWLTEETLRDIPLHHQFDEFLQKVLRTLP